MKNLNEPKQFNWKVIAGVIIVALASYFGIPLN